MPVFQTSINIKYDLGKKEFYDRYIPTSAHSEVLKGIIDGINNEGKKSHIALGPYGTGKSLITTLIAGIVSKQIDDETFTQLLCKFNNSDEEIYNKLLRLKEHKQIIPIIFNGFEGDFEEIVINKMLKVLNSNGIKIVGTNVHLNIINTINDWKENFPVVYKSLLMYLTDSEYKNINQFISELSIENSKAINYFLHVYPNITGGNTFVSNADKSFMSRIEDIIQQLEKQGKGVLIVYDEFGRFLQTLPESKIQKTMGLLQDLAEFIDHKSNNSNLLLITHKHLSDYFSRYSNYLKNEFDRIEKRFRLYTIRNDQETFFNIANQIISNYNIEECTIDYVNQQMTMLRRYNLFQYNQTVIQNKIVKGCYPLHPVTIYMLSKLTALCGQNERTLFTFLESEETGGLLNHINKDNGVYLVYKLFDYFFPHIKDSNSENHHDYIGKYNKLIYKISSSNIQKEELQNILKFITIWEVTNSNSIQKLSTEFMNYVFDANIESLIEELKRLKLIRYNRNYHKWELFEGSSIDINRKLKEVKNSLVITVDEKTELINKFLLKKYYLSEQYNHEKSINRFSLNKVITVDQFLNDNIHFDKKQADIYIYYILKGNTNSYDEVIKKISDLSDDYKIFCYLNISINKLDNLIVKWYCLYNMLKDKEFYSSDYNLKEELNVEITEVEYELKKNIHKIQDFSSDNKWYYKSKSININSEMSLLNLLSDIFYGIYKYTPEIKNEMFNRRYISKQQLKAAKKLIDNIITNPMIDQFGLQGKGPDYLIYATVFKNNELYSGSDYRKIKDENIRELYKRVMTTIKVKERSQFIDLVNIFTETPFGIRKPVIPVLLVGLLKNKWKYIMFYCKGTFIPNVTSENLYDMIDHPEDFEYIVFEYDETYTDFFKSMSNIFADNCEPILEDKPLHIKVAAAMLKWLQSLPKISQTTEFMDESIKRFRESVKRIEIDPYSIFKELRAKYELNEDIIGINKMKLDQHFSEYLLKIYKKVYSYINNNRLKEWVIISKTEHPNNLLLKIIEESKYDINLSIMSKRLIGVNLEDWTEQTEIIFFNELNKRLKEIKEIEFDTNKHIKILIGTEKTIVQKNLDLSTKGNLIYKNITRIIDTQGKYINKEELDYIMFKLMDKFVI